MQFYKFLLFSSLLSTCSVQIESVSCEIPISLDHLDKNALFIQNNNDQAQEIALRLLKITKTDTEVEPLTKEIAGRILDINPFSSSTQAQEAFDQKLNTWNAYIVSSYTRLVSDYYTTYLLRALTAFKPITSIR